MRMSTLEKNKKVVYIPYEGINWAIITMKIPMECVQRGCSIQIFPSRISQNLQI